MRRVAAFVVLFILSISSVTAFSDTEVGVIDQEIRFQDLEWGVSDRVVVDDLSAKGLIDKYYFNGSGGKPCFVWPENDLDLRIKSYAGLFPEKIKKNKWQGLWSLSFSSKKTIGGHEADAVSFQYYGNISTHAISDKCDHLIAVVVSYKSRSSDEPIADVYVDLLDKLQEQYGTFKIYVNKKKLDKKIKKNSKERDEDIIKLLKEKVVKMSSSVTKFKEDGIYAFAVLHGKNDTGIVLRLLASNHIELIYSKTDSSRIIPEMITVLENNKNQKQDLGL